MSGFLYLITDLNSFKYFRFLMSFGTMFHIFGPRNYNISLTLLIIVGDIPFITLCSLTVSNWMFLSCIVKDPYLIKRSLKDEILSLYTMRGALS